MREIRGGKPHPPLNTLAADGLQTLYAWAKDAVGIISEMATAVVDISIFVNTPPVADAGPDQTVEEGASVTLNGSNSDDSDNGIKSFFWEAVGGNHTVTLSDPYAEQPSFAAPDVGPGGVAFTFRLTVTDYSDEVSTDTCIVNISWVNIAPVADAGFDQTVTEGTRVTLNGGASDGVDDSIDTYLWEQLDDSGAAVALSDPTAANPSFTLSDVGPDGHALTFQLTVTDQGGLRATDLCIINVTNVNQAPIADAGSDQSVLAGGEVSLDASGSHDPDGDAITTTWKQIDGTPVTLTAPSASSPGFIAPDVATGTSETLTFELTVTDAGELKATDICHIQVNGEELPPVEEPPVVEPPVVEPPVEEPPVVEPPVIDPPTACGDHALPQMKRFLRLSKKFNDRAKVFEKKSEKLEKASERTKNKNGKRAKTLEAKAIKMKRLSIKSARKAEQFKEKYEALKNCIETNGEDDSHDDEESDDDNDEDEDEKDEDKADDD